MKRRTLVGLTGTFGSGKTTAARFFKSCGAWVISSDALVDEAYSPQSAVYRRIAKTFGWKKVDRKEIAKVVFSNSSKRRKLEKLIHPYVFRRIRQEVKRVRRGIVVIEVPLLFETKFDQKVDWTVVVTSRPNLILKRLAKKGFSTARVNARRKAQWPIQKKIKKANFIIGNTGSFTHLKKQTKEVWNHINHQPVSSASS